MIWPRWSHAARYLIPSPEDFSDEPRRIVVRKD